MSKHWTVGMTLRDSEKVIIEDCLGFHEGNKTLTARSLGISLRGLYGKLNDLGVAYDKTEASELESDGECREGNQETTPGGSDRPNKRNNKKRR